jgi:YidC/Oxa1 family membrane protein insertase
VSYSSTLVLTSGPCAACTWDWLVNILVKVLVFFHAIARDWGVAIILLVVLVRALLHPITKRSQISMAKMGKMGPEMERLRKKHGDNKEELTKAMWELQKQQGVGPYLGCLPMFLQMPIWIALWQALQTTFELRQAPFLYYFGKHLTWIHDLSKPDHLIELSQPLFANVWWLPTISGLNVLPILMGLVFWIQMKIQPKPAAMTPEQEQQQKMMLVMMPVLFPLMLYSGPSGLNLYIMTSTFLGIIESKIVRDHIKKKDDAEKAGKVIVDAGKKFKGGGTPPPKKKKGPDGDKPRGIMGWFAELQERAEQIRREAEKRK